MKKILILLLVGISLYSCDCTPILNSDKPFIVNQITSLDNGFSEYFGGYESRYNAEFSGRPSIVLPSRLFQIGDTITIKK